MKKYFSILLLVMVAFFSSCSKDDDVSTSVLDNLVGTWQSEQTNGTYTIEISRGTSNSTGETVYYGSYYIQYANGSKAYIYQNTTLSTKYKHDDILVVGAYLTVAGDEYPYKLSGSTLEIDDKTFTRIK